MEDLTKKQYQVLIDIMEAVLPDTKKTLAVLLGAEAIDINNFLAIIGQQEQIIEKLKFKRDEKAD